VKSAHSFAASFCAMRAGMFRCSVIPPHAGIKVHAVHARVQISAAAVAPATVPIGGLIWLPRLRTA
jgi:hypothetical protein